jgi:hypothetical protein
VVNYAAFISEFFMGQWSSVMPKDYQGPPMTFLIGGYDQDQPYGTVYMVEIPQNPTPVIRKPNDAGSGLDWGGQIEIATRLIKGVDPALLNTLISKLNLSPEQQAKVIPLISPFELQIPYPVLPLQDCVDLAVFLIRTTITAQNLTLGIRGVGGTIEVAIIQRTKPFHFVQQRELHA